MLTGHGLKSGVRLGCAHKSVKSAHKTELVTVAQVHKFFFDKLS